jgi:uncharacterized damage-inducible protein DinB
MDKYYFCVLAKYNQGANEKMNTIIEQLSHEKWEKQHKGYFKSVRELCSHIYIYDCILLKRLNQLHVFESLNDEEILGKNYTIKDVLFPSIDEYLLKRKNLDIKMIDFSEELTISDLRKYLEYKDSNGNDIKKKFNGLLLHLFVHQIHHRGVISSYLEIMGKENNYNMVYPYI